MRWFSIFILVLVVTTVDAQDNYWQPKPMPLGKPMVLSVTSEIEENVDLRYAITNYGVKEGLQNSSFRDVFIDSRHMMWLSSYGGGLIKYDGKNFTQYTVEDGLNNNQVFEVVEDQQGNIWIANDGGVNMYDGQQFHNIMDTSMVQPANSWSIFCDDENTIWIGTAAMGVYYLKDDLLHSFNEETGYEHLGIYDLIKDSKGRMWFANVRNGVWMWDGDVFKGFAQVEIPNWGIISAREIFEDSKQNIWIGSMAGAFKVSGGQETHYFRESGIPDFNVSAFFEDTDGLIWLGQGKGVSILHPETNEIRNIGAANGLYGDMVYGIAGDHEGNVWLANGSYGIAKYEGLAFTHLVPPGVIGENTVFNVFVDEDQSIWFSSVKGLHHFKDGICTTYNDEGVVLNGVLSIKRGNDGQLWLGTSTCLAKFFEDRVEAYSKDQNLLKGEIKDIEFDDSGRIWAGGRWGVSVIYNDQTYLLNEAHGMPHYLTNSLELDHNGNIWMSTFGGGLCMMPVDSLGAMNNPFQVWGTNQGLGTGNAISAAVDQHGNIWSAVFGSGVQMMSAGSTPDQTNWWFLNEHYELTDNNAVAVKVGDNGAIWTAAVNGMSYLLLDNDTLIRNLFYEDGFLGIETSWDGITLAPDNSAWFATSDRATNYNPIYHFESQEPPKLAIQSVRLFQEPINWETSSHQFNGQTHWYALPKELVLEYEFAHVTIDFQGITYNDPKEVKYQWILDGFDSDWNPISTQLSMTYPNLQAGNYTFRVRARGSNGVWSEEQTFSFIILPPYWQTWWFRLLMGMLAIVIIWFAIRIRTGTLKKRQRELERTVEERTVEIREQKHLVEEKNQEITDSITYAKRIQHAILPSGQSIKEQLGESFVLYKPKDIVAGDFYWLEKTEDKVLFAVADCTGHGVPGAMVSVICNNALNRSVREYGLNDPGEILNKTREIVVQEFEKSDEEVKDGMDIALCAMSDKKLEYAGAHNPLWLMRKGEIIEMKADKQPIGNFENAKPYTAHSLDLQQDDMIFIFSDGFVDQFGGQKGKKFKAKAFRELLLSIQDRNMEEQRMLINEEFEQWRGDLEQVDDVCVIGVRI